LKPEPERMRYFFTLIALIIIVSCTNAQSADSLLKELDATLERKDEFIQARLKRIQDYKARIANTAERFYLYNKVYDEYKTFIYDSAFVYARKLQLEAYRQNDPVKIAYAKVKLGFVLLSSGMFNEALDSLETIRAKGLPDSIKVEYYSVLSRTFYDLIDFNKDQYYEAKYLELGNIYIDSALWLSQPGTVKQLLLQGLKDLKTSKWDVARDVFEKLITNERLTDSQLAVAASTLGFIYLREGNPEKVKWYLTLAAIADIRSSTKETLAMLNLAEVLYKEGDVKAAYAYIKQAMEDANFYGARHRKIQVASIFPLIEGDELSTVERQRKTLFLYSIAVTLLTVLTILFVVIIFKQFKKLQAAKTAISDANSNLQEVNTRLNEVNHQVMEMNHKLVEANKIKEEYIGFYFNINTEYLEKIEAFRRSIDNKLMQKKFDDIRMVVGNINIKKEREELYFSFDKIFLKLFPDFVTTFNSFFKEEDRIVLKEGQLLNTELRIFALIRMGIHDTEKIAKILDYSINTIYNYKARVKSKSIIPNEEFEKRIMEIQAL
jgi:tetratricopeptide (TPR) repeat protein